MSRDLDHAGAPDDVEARLAAAEAAFAAAHALRDRLQPGAEALAALAAPLVAAIPCPRCEAVETVALPPGEPLRARACSRCGGPLDPREPFAVPAHALDAVIAGTTATLVLVLARARHPLAALPGLMGAGLRAARGAFVVGVGDTAAEPEIAERLGLDGPNAICFYQRGQRLGAIALPGGLEDLARRGRSLFDWLAGAATGASLPLPFLGAALAGPRPAGPLPGGGHP
jgi:hypothetical protein